MFTTEAQKTWRQRQLRQALKLRPKLLKLRRSDGKVTCSRLKLNLRPKIKLDECLQWQGHPLQALVDTMTWRYVWMAKTRIENKTIARSSWAPGFVCSKPKAKPQVWFDGKLWSKLSQSEKNWWQRQLLQALVKTFGQLKLSNLNHWSYADRRPNLKLWRLDGKVKCSRLRWNLRPNFKFRRLHHNNQ